MRGILVVVTPLARHVKPRLPVAQQLVRDRHQVLFQGADIVPLRWKAGGLQFLPLIGNANHDYHRFGDSLAGCGLRPPPMDQASQNDESRSPLLRPLEGLYNR
jgi:hypothetical protein